MAILRSTFASVMIGLMACLVFDASAQISRPKEPVTVQSTRPSTLPQSRSTSAAAKAMQEQQAKACQRLEPELTTDWYPSFDWSMPKRYGNDREVYDDGKGGKTGNGIIDLPNSRAYVTNTRSYSNDARDACSCVRGPNSSCEARFRVNLFDKDSRAARWRQNANSLRKARSDQQCPPLTIPNTPRLSAVSFSVDGKSHIVNGDDPVSLCLTEGHHHVTMEMRYGEEARSVTRTIEVIDHLIVNLGDSYGAGEGTPETNFRPEKMEHFAGWGSDDKVKGVDWTENYIQNIPFFAQWADPGIAIPMTTKKIYAYSEIWADKVSYDNKDYKILRQEWDDVRFRSDVTMPDWEAIKRRFYDAGQPDAHPYKILMDHHHAHRSSATGASQLALHLEHHDEKSSVTFVNLAASGATMENGILGPYRGVFELKSKGNMGTFIPNNGAGLKPQIEELSEMIGDREVDHIYLSVGGNDAGFVNVIETFLMAWNWENTPFHDGSDEYDWNVKDMLDILETGRWDEANFGPTLLSAAWGDRDRTAGLGGLLADYKAVNQRLLDRLGWRVSDNVTLIGYPDFSSSARTDMDPKLSSRMVDDEPTYFCDVKVDKFEDPTLHREWLKFDFSDGAPMANVDLDFDPHEFRIAQREVVGPLFRRMSDAVTAINKANSETGAPLEWSILSQGPTPRYHGICGWGQYDRYEFARRYGNYRKAIQDDGSYLTNTVADRRGFAWYRSPQAGAATQRGEAVTNTGLFHPNEFGYRHVGRRMMEELEFYGAELGEDAFISEARLHQFVDTNDSIREARRITRPNVPNAIEGSLAGSQDVQAYKIMATNKRCTPFTVSLDDAAIEAGLAIWVFGMNGEAVASTHDNPSTPRLIGSQTGVSAQAVQTPLSSGLTRRQNKAVTDALSQANEEKYGGKFCPANAYAALETKRVADRRNKSISFLPEHRGQVVVMISHGDNQKFDPVTGRGDNRTELDREKVSFKGRIDFD